MARVSAFFLSGRFIRITCDRAAPLDDDMVGHAMVPFGASRDQLSAGLGEALAAADDHFLQGGGFAKQIVAIEAAERDPLAALRRPALPCTR